MATTASAPKSPNPPPPAEGATIGATVPPPPEYVAPRRPSLFSRFFGAIGRFFKNHRSALNSTIGYVGAVVMCTATYVGAQLTARLLVAHVAGLAVRSFMGIPVVNIIAFALYFAIMMLIGWFTNRSLRAWTSSAHIAADVRVTPPATAQTAAAAA